MPRAQVIPRLRQGAKCRSAVSNRSRLFVDRDARGPWARRYADLVAMIADDLGGAETMTELKLSMVRRAAALILECERLEGELASGHQVDVDQLGRIAGHLRRIGDSLGLDRVIKDITPSLGDIIAKSQAKPQTAQKPARARKPSAGAVLEGEIVEPIHAPPEPAEGAQCDR